MLAPAFLHWLLASHVSLQFILEVLVYCLAFQRVSKHDLWICHGLPLLRHVFLLEAKNLDDIQHRFLARGYPIVAQMQRHDQT